MSDKPKPKLRVVGKEPVEHQTPDDPKPVSRDTIQALEQLLQQAKEGSILGIATVLLMPDDMISMDYVGESVSYETIGALEELKPNILEELRDQE
jgi:hypothetical protein